MKDKPSELVSAVNNIQSLVSACNRCEVLDFEISLDEYCDQIIHATETSEEEVAGIINRLRVMGTNLPILREYMRKQKGSALNPIENAIANLKKRLTHELKWA